MLIVANWKAYVETVAQAKALAAGGKRLALKGAHSIVLAPSAPFLGLLAPLAGKAKNRVQYAAQDISLTPVGAHTGEVAASQMVGIGAQYVILGHSERRAAGETDLMIAEKVRAALAAKLTPIVCVGETERDEDARYLSILREQIRSVVEPLSAKERLGIIIAYEPVWAIGRSALQAITPADLVEMVLYIRKLLAEHMPGKSASKVRILYGGSVDPANARQLAEEGGIDGFLIGRASIEVKTFNALVQALP